MKKNDFILKIVPYKMENYSITDDDVPPIAVAMKKIIEYGLSMMPDSFYFELEKSKFEMTDIINSVIYGIRNENFPDTKVVPKHDGNILEAFAYFVQNSGFTFPEDLIFYYINENEGYKALEYFSDLGAPSSFVGPANHLRRNILHYATIDVDEIRPLMSDEKIIRMMIALIKGGADPRLIDRDDTSPLEHDYSGLLHEAVKRLES